MVRVWVLPSPRLCLLGDMGEGPQGRCVLVGGLGLPLGCCPSSHAFSPLSIAQCSAGLCFNGGHCVPGSAQLCYCPRGFQGPRCQYGEWMDGHSRSPQPAPWGSSEVVAGWGGGPETPSTETSAPHPLRAHPVQSRPPERWAGMGRVAGRLGSGRSRGLQAAFLPCRSPLCPSCGKTGGVQGPTGGDWFGETWHICELIDHEN